MDNAAPTIHLVRHGETAWAVEGRHTGRSDVPLTARGEENARQLARPLAAIAFARVWTSPLMRARRTCELAGFASCAQADPDLVEWDYGDYEGRRGAEIRHERPDWSLFRDGCPNGESVADIGARADRVLARLRGGTGNTLLFAHGHILRVLAARWLGLEPGAGRLLGLSTASRSILGYEHDGRDPVLLLWNQELTPG